MPLASSSAAFTLCSETSSSLQSQMVSWNQANTLHQVIFNKLKKNQSSHCSNFCIKLFSASTKPFRMFSASACCLEPMRKVLELFNLVSKDCINFLKSLVPQFASEQKTRNKIIKGFHASQLLFLQAVSKLTSTGVLVLLVPARLPRCSAASDSSRRVSRSISLFTS